jgi:flavodoxin II
MKNIGLFYGSTTCYTEMVAEKIRDILGHDLVDLHNINSVSPDTMQQYEILILGIPTWDFGELQEDWEAAMPQLSKLDLRGKIVALFGLGDQIGYSEWFLDAMGILYRQLQSNGVTFIGSWSTEGYDFTSTQPLLADHSAFVGLAIDEVNQYELTDQRLAQWCSQLLVELSQLA